MAKDDEKEQILRETYEPGAPDGPQNWRNKLRTREEKLKYIKSGERYWYGESHGSERRRTPA